MTDEKAIEKMLYDQQQGWPLCPRCGERMPDKLTHGALSRHAKGVYICEACCTDEVLTNKKSPYTGQKVNAGGFLRATEVAKYKIKSGPCRAALYKSRSFSSASILHGTHAAVKTFCSVLRS